MHELKGRETPRKTGKELGPVLLKSYVFLRETEQCVYGAGRVNNS